MTQHYLLGMQTFYVAIIIIVIPIEKKVFLCITDIFLQFYVYYAAAK